MAEQPTLPAVEGLPAKPPPKICAWCLNDATTTIEVEPAIKGKGRHDKQVIKRSAITAPCCAPCKLRLENRKAQA